MQVHHDGKVLVATICWKMIEKGDPGASVESQN
jgi:hypothetical protein